MNKIPVLKIKDEKGNLIPINALRGASAYEQAVEGGYKGTKEEFLAFLNGLTKDASHYTNTDNPHGVTKEQVGLEGIGADENGDMVCENGLKMFKDFSMQGERIDSVYDSETGNWIPIYATINGPFYPIFKVDEIECCLHMLGNYVRDGLELVDYDHEEPIRETFPPEYFDYEIQPSEGIGEEYYDFFCEGKFVLKSDGVVYSLNSELADLTPTSPSTVEGHVLDDALCVIRLKVIITTDTHRLSLYQEHLKSLENGGGEE